MILLRHGQSTFNAVFSVTRIDPGIPDPPLTEEGRRQAEAAARALGAYGLKRLLVSPYTRTLQTAQIIAEALHLPIVIEPLVRERRHFACDVGTVRAELAKAWPHLDFAELTERWWPDDEEHEPLMLERCRLFRERMAQVDDWRATGVISHWAFIRGLTGRALPNAAMLVFDPVEGRAEPHGADHDGKGAHGIGN